MAQCRGSRSAKMAADAPPPAAIERPPQLGISPTRLNFQCPPPLPPRPPLTHPSPHPNARRHSRGAGGAAAAAADEPLVGPGGDVQGEDHRPEALPGQPQRRGDRARRHGGGQGCAAHPHPSPAPLTPPAPAVLLLAMEQYPDPAKRRDRFLIQAAWADQTPAAELDVAERVTPTPPPPPPATCPDSAPCCSTVAGAASVDGQGGQRHGLGRVQARECPDRPFSHQRVSHPGGRRRGIHTRLHASQRRARNPFSKPEYRA